MLVKCSFQQPSTIISMSYFSGVLRLRAHLPLPEVAVWIRGHLTERWRSLFRYRRLVMWTDGQIRSSPRTTGCLRVLFHGLSCVSTWPFHGTTVSGDEEGVFVKSGAIDRASCNSEFTGNQLLELIQRSCNYYHQRKSWPGVANDQIYIQSHASGGIWTATFRFQSINLPIELPWNCWENMGFSRFSTKTWIDHTKKFLALQTLSDNFTSRALLVSFLNGMQSEQRFRDRYTSTVTCDYLKTSGRQKMDLNIFIP